MNEQLITDIEQAMLPVLDNAQTKQLHDVLNHFLWNKTVSDETAEMPRENVSYNSELLDIFLSSKRVEGCSEKTLRYYKATISRLFAGVQQNVTHITTDDLRRYLADYQQINNCSKTNIDNIRRILSSFFSWLEDENYILKSPVRRIHKIRTNKTVKETYSDEALEMMRDGCHNLRDLAMVDLLASSGMRVGELVKLNIADIDFENRECMVALSRQVQKCLHVCGAGLSVHPQRVGEERCNADSFVGGIPPQVL